MTGPERGDSERTPEFWRGRLATRSWPLDGPGPWQSESPDAGYEGAAECLARALLIVAEERPELLDVTEERRRDPSGWEAANNDKLWEAAKEKWPGLDDWLGGVTGFQYGWVHNIVRFIVGAPPTGNPAIATVGD